MELEEIEVVIDKSGQVQVVVRGVKGGKCLEMTKALEAALGGEVLSRELTAEASEALGAAASAEVWQRSG